MKGQLPLAGTSGRVALVCALWGWSGFGHLVWGQSTEDFVWLNINRASVTQVEFYLKSYPEGRYVKNARQCLIQIARHEPRASFTDGCAGCPELVLVPPGTYTMGSKRTETGRTKFEEPLHEVAIGVPFAVGTHEVTRGEFRRFAEETGYLTGRKCYTMDKSDGKWRAGEFSWVQPNFDQTDDHPVVCVDWADANAYADWLSEQTEANYRLISESEWEYVARAGTDTSRYWGALASTQCGYENGRDRTFSERYGHFRKKSGRRWRTAPCSDGHVFTAPVKSARPNGFGLYDMLGNVREWVADCWHDRYANSPTDGSARTGELCEFRTVRAGSWANEPKRVRSAMRARWLPPNRSDVLGFRVAKTVRWGGNGIVGSGPDCEGEL